MIRQYSDKYRIKELYKLFSNGRYSDYVAKHEGCLNLDRWTMGYWDRNGTITVEARYFLDENEKEQQSVYETSIEYHVNGHHKRFDFDICSIFSKDLEWAMFKKILSDCVNLANEDYTE